MKLIEKLSQDWFVANSAENLKGGGTFSTSDAFETGFRKARDLILDILDEVGPGAAETMGVPRDLGEEETEA